MIRIQTRQLVISRILEMQLQLFLLHNHIMKIKLNAKQFLVLVIETKNRLRNDSLPFQWFISIQEITSGINPNCYLTFITIIL